MGFTVNENEKYSTKIDDENFRTYQPFYVEYDEEPVKVLAKKNTKNRRVSRVLKILRVIAEPWPRKALFSLAKMKYIAFGLP